MATGILIIDKASDWTSMDVCAKLRGIFHERRIGHGGTLDPMATGVLPVFLGKATKAIEWAANSDKEYVAALQLGVITNTQDTTGEVLETRPVTAKLEDLEQVLAQFRGPIQQIPPMYSAIKRNGKKLYELARKGQEVEREPRSIEIKELEVLRDLGEHRYELRVLCTKGTYVRTLCHDIGAALGCGGTMAALRRTRAAGYSLADAHSLEEVQAAADAGTAEALLLPLDSCFADRPALTLSGDAERRLRCGQGIPVGNIGAGEYRLYSESGSFLALSRVSGGVAVSVKNFFEGV